MRPDRRPVGLPAGSLTGSSPTTSGKAPELYSDVLLPALREGVEKASRSMNDLDRLIEMKVSFDPDEERARQDTRFWAALALKPDQKAGVEDPLEMQRLADELPIELAASRWTVSRDPDVHVQRIGAYLDLGFRHLVFHAPGHDQERFSGCTANRCYPGSGS